MSSSEYPKDSIVLVAMKDGYCVGKVVGHIDDDRAKVLFYEHELVEPDSPGDWRLVVPHTKTIAHSVRFASFESHITLKKPSKGARVVRLTQAACKTVTRFRM